MVTKKIKSKLRDLNEDKKALKEVSIFFMGVGVMFFLNAFIFLNVNFALLKEYNLSTNIIMQNITSIVFSFLGSIMIFVLAYCLYKQNLTN